MKGLDVPQTGALDDSEFQVDDDFAPEQVVPSQQRTESAQIKKSDF